MVMRPSPASQDTMISLSLLLVIPVLSALAQDYGQHYQYPYRDDARYGDAPTATVNGGWEEPSSWREPTRHGRPVAEHHGRDSCWSTCNQLCRDRNVVSTVTVTVPGPERTSHSCFQPRHETSCAPCKQENWFSPCERRSCQEPYTVTVTAYPEQTGDYYGRGYEHGHGHGHRGHTYGEHGHEHGYNGHEHGYNGGEHCRRDTLRSWTKFSKTGDDWQRGPEVVDVSYHHDVDLTVTDDHAKNHRFEVFVDGHSIGKTPDFEVDYHVHCGPDADLCIKRGLSHRTFHVPAGSHRVTIKLIGKDPNFPGAKRHGGQYKITKRC